MNPLSSLQHRQPDSGQKLRKQSRLYKTILKAVAARKAENIIVLDLRKVHEAVSDFFVICEATTNTQVKAIADHVDDLVKEETGEHPHRTEGYTHGKWVVVDYVNVVVHIMQPETRAFYNLEEMWHDAPLERIEDV